MTTLRNINSDFADYNGTKNYYRHWLGGIFTDGIKAVADKLQVYWPLFSYNIRE